jgi:integrase
MRYSFMALREPSPQLGKSWDPNGPLESRNPTAEGKHMKKRLTDRLVRSIEPPANERVTYTDTEAPGLDLRISTSGSKSWSIRYRVKGKERRRTTYGTYPAIPLIEARARAREIAAAAARGIDLLEREKRQREEQDKAEGRPVSLANLLDNYVEKYCKPNQRQWRLVEGMFQNHVKPVLGKRSLAELRRADLVELLDHLQNEKGMHAQVNRVRSHLIHCLNWAIEHEYLEVNPFAAVKRRKVEKARDRVLHDDELRAVWCAANRLPNPSRSFVQALILTGQRRDEVRCMNWSEIDLDHALWTIPASRNKGKRDHQVPLAPAMLTLLGNRPREGGPVLSVNRQKPYTGHKWLKAILDRESGVVGWVFHDLRRSCASGLAALRITQDVIDRVLGHAKPGLAGTYNRFEYLEAKRKALELWAERVAFIVGDGRDAANVVERRANT